MSVHQVLINGQWRDADATGTFQAFNPASAEAIADEYPVSSWADCDAALDAAQSAFEELRKMPSEKIAKFLEVYADKIDARVTELSELANMETALPVSPRLADVELPRTSGQLRKAAQAARDGSWTLPTIDSAVNIRSFYAAIGPVAVFGPNNFPFAFGSISGGDFAAAIASGNPVIAKSNSLHPGTTRLFAEEAQKAADETGMPAGTVQLIYRTSHDVGERLVSDPRIAATGYTGSRHAGLKLKQAADAAGKPIYLELSSVNPVVILPGALSEKGEELAAEFSGSCLLGTGQFCTNPGMVVLIEGDITETFINSVTEKFAAAAVGTLLSSSGLNSLGEAIVTLNKAGADILVGGQAGGGNGYSYANTLMRISGDDFIKNPETLQTEAFGNASLLLVCKDVDQTAEALKHLEGNLTGCIYSASSGADDQAYTQIEPVLRQAVGRLLNDKMPTGVAVSIAMNHGGPYPATGHSGFTAVGVPGSLRRFSMLQCYDAVRPDRLPELLKDQNPTKAWRFIDGDWTQGDVGSSS